YKTTKNYIQQEKFVTLFGGEHSISIGTIRAFNESFEDLTVVQIDAHADLRKEYEGSKCNHACAVHEASKTTNLIQVGIRSMDAEELEYMDENQVYFAHDLYEVWMDDAIGQMTPNVFLTIDLDAFDPSILPSTGTPEPGGLFWYETLDFIRTIFKKKNVVGFDIVELCPNPAEKSSDFLAAKLYYKMLSYKFKYEDYDGEDEDE
ncbi:MAG TPA: agmatinase, partial [Flavobacteriaceae bacterium]|nr:agmatinase [Flavobacteriaceae bacterium]